MMDDVSQASEASTPHQTSLTPPPNSISIPPSDSSMSTNNTFITNTTTTGLLAELQCVLACMCFNDLPKEGKKIEELQVMMIEKLTSSSERVGFAEQMWNSSPPFDNLFDVVPVETHGSNENLTSSVTHRLKIKNILVGDTDHEWFMDKHFSKEKLTYGLLSQVPVNSHNATSIMDDLYLP